MPQHYDQVTVNPPTTFPLNKITVGGNMDSDTAFMTYQVDSGQTTNLPFTPNATTWTLNLTNDITTTGSHTLAVTASDINGFSANSATLTITAAISSGGGLAEEQASLVLGTIPITPPPRKHHLCFSPIKCAPNSTVKVPLAPHVDVERGNGVWIIAWVYPRTSNEPVLAKKLTHCTQLYVPVGAAGNYFVTILTVVRQEVMSGDGKGRGLACEKTKGLAGWSEDIVWLLACD